MTKYSTKSGILRTIDVQDDMPKEQVQRNLLRTKQLIEQNTNYITQFNLDDVEVDLGGNTITTTNLADGGVTVSHLTLGKIIEKYRPKTCEKCGAPLTDSDKCDYCGTIYWAVYKYD